jgi:hypothetical protein
MYDEIANGVSRTDKVTVNSITPYHCIGFKMDNIRIAVFDLAAIPTQIAEND